MQSMDLTISIYVKKITQKRDVNFISVKMLCEV